MAMKTTQAWGWLAAGVLALGLNGIYQDGGAVWAQRIVDRMVYGSTDMMQQASDRTDQFLERVRTVVSRDQTQSCRFATAVARVQTKIANSQNGFARLEAMSAREEAQLARLEANRARIEAQVAQFRFDGAAFRPMLIKSIVIKRGGFPVVCPRIRVNVPAMNPRAPMMPVSVHVGMAGPGPV
jgi:hypothetical protein